MVCSHDYTYRVFLLVLDPFEQGGMLMTPGNMGPCCRNNVLYLTGLSWVKKPYGREPWFFRASCRFFGGCSTQRMLECCRARSGGAGVDIRDNIVDLAHDACDTVASAVVSQPKQRNLAGEQWASTHDYSLFVYNRRRPREAPFAYRAAPCLRHQPDE